jgi:putative holliday junction resolvase
VATTARPSANTAGTILAFDFGTRRIGVAVGESSTGLAHPLATIAEQRRDARFAAIGKLVDEWRPALLVIGVPTHADGREHALTASARRFARQLEGRYGVAVALADERYTTRSAGEALAAAGVRAHNQRGVRDQVAAQLILQDYLDQQRSRPRTA